MDNAVALVQAYLHINGYFTVAEQRGFRGDAALDDWLRAEAEISARLPGIG